MKQDNQMASLLLLSMLSNKVKNDRGFNDYHSGNQRDVSAMLEYLNAECRHRVAARDHQLYEHNDKTNAV